MGELMKKFKWQGLGLTLFLAFAAVDGLVRSGLRGDLGGMVGTLLLPLLFWLGFSWQHYWRKEPKPFNWADTVLGIIGWIGALSIMGLAKH